MTAIQLLEKLGAEASLNPSQISHCDKREIDELINNSGFFNAVLVHSPADDDDDDDTEESPEEKSAN